MSRNWAWSLMLRCCEVEPANLRLCFEAKPADRHYVALALRGMERQGDGPKALEELARQLPAEKRRLLLERLWGADLGNLSVLRRCGIQVWSRGVYDQLAGLLSAPTARAALLQMERITASTVTELARASRQLFAVGGGRLAQQIGAPTAEYLLQALRSLRPDLPQRKIAAILAEATVRDAEDCELALWHLLRKRVVPSVPWAGTDGIRPLTTVGEMQATAREFHNCLGSPERGWEALAGRRVFYRVDHPYRAIVALRRDILIDAWRVDEVKGLHNRDLAPAARAAVLDGFARAGFPYIQDTPTLRDLLAEPW